MKDISGFLLKVIVGSTLISFAIKYAGPFLPIAANSFNALIIALLPSILLGIALAWRSASRKSSPQRSSHS
jgi:uncharacterized membrane protein